MDLTGTDRDIALLAAENLESLNFQEAEKLYESLSSQVDRDRREYYFSSSPSSSDAAYDARIGALRKLEGMWGELKRRGASQKVGSEPSGKGVLHPSKMLSLEDVFSKDELEEWYLQAGSSLKIRNLEVSCEVKIDGLAVDLVYEGGILTSASTRGDGVKGEDITQAALLIPSIPKRLRGEVRTDFLEVRGEAFMKFEDFNALNAKRESENLAPFANPRNAAAGSLRRKDPSQAAESALSFLAHGAGAVKWRGKPLSTLSEIYGLYESYGIPVSPYRSVETGFAGIWKMAELLGEKRDKLEHPLDGMVVKVNSLSLQGKLGATSHAPRWAVAYKYPAQEAHTVLEGVKIQVGRTGKVTPIAVLSPVLLAGSVVSRATLHNMEVFGKKRIMIGDTVVVKKAGDVIPEVVAPILSARIGKRLSKFSEPSECPYCGSKLERREGSPDLECPNREGCPAQTLGRLLYISGRKIFDIDELGEESACALCWPERGRPPLEKFLPGAKEVEVGLPIPSLSSPLPPLQRAALPSEAGLFGLKPEDLKEIRVWREIPLVERKPGKKRILGGSGYFRQIFPFKTDSGSLNANAEKMLEEIKKAKNSGLSKLLAALCIRHMGINTSKLVASHFRSFSAVRRARKEDFMKIKGVGEVTARAAEEYFAASLKRGSFEEKVCSAWIGAGLGKMGDAALGGRLSGLTIVVTGSLKNYTRQEIGERIEAEGGKSASAVSSKTDYLVAGENCGSKLQKAERLGIKVITEEEFESLIKE